MRLCCHDVVFLVLYQGRDEEGNVDGISLAKGGADER